MYVILFFVCVIVWKYCISRAVERNFGPQEKEFEFFLLVSNIYHKKTIHLQK